MTAVVVLVISYNYCISLWTEVPCAYVQCIVSVCTTVHGRKNSQSIPNAVTPSDETEHLTVKSISPVVISLTSNSLFNCACRGHDLCRSFVHDMQSAHDLLCATYTRPAESCAEDSSPDTAHVLHVMLILPACTFALYVACCASSMYGNCHLSASYAMTSKQCNL